MQGFERGENIGPGIKGDLDGSNLISFSTGPTDRGIFYAEKQARILSYSLLSSNHRWNRIKLLPRAIKWCFLLEWIAWIVFNIMYGKKL